MLSNLYTKYLLFIITLFFSSACNESKKEDKKNDNKKEDTKSDKQEEDYSYLTPQYNFYQSLLKDSIKLRDYVLDYAREKRQYLLELRQTYQNKYHQERCASYVYIQNTYEDIKNDYYRYVNNPLKLSCSYVYLIRLDSELTIRKISIDNSFYISQECINFSSHIIEKVLKKMRFRKRRGANCQEYLVYFVFGFGNDDEAIIRQSFLYPSDSLWFYKPLQNEITIHQELDEKIRLIKIPEKFLEE